MDTKSFKSQILNGSIARRVIFRSILLASAISLASLLHVLSLFNLASLVPLTATIYFHCDSQNANVNNPGSYFFPTRFWGSVNCEKDANLTVNVVNELMGERLLHLGGDSLCVGEGSTMAVAAMKQLGFSSVSGVQTHRFFSLKQKKIVYELDFKDSSFDFVFSRDLDQVSVPALHVLEVERVLKPGGVAALLVSATGSNSNDLIRAATPVSSLLRSSSVVHVGYADEKLDLVVFKKRIGNASSATSFYHHSLPMECPSLTFTKPLIELMEPLVSEKPPIEFERRVPYLPKFVDVSNRKRLVYIDVGVKELLNANVSDWFLPSYPIDPKDFNVYFVHYNTSIMLSYVKRPGITFVYHPGLAGGGGKAMGAKGDADEDMDPFLGEEEFDFLAWFKETVQYADFVVLKMNAGKAELKFLSDIFENGTICFVHEMFLGCPEKEEEDDDKTMTIKERCMDIYKGLRSNGVYVHQWWGG